MAATWDPANLLQISYDIDNDFALISCVGEDETRLNRPRCRYSVPEIWYPEIRSQLTRLSTRDPECASAAQLIELARICLCEESHQHQAEAVAERWLDVVHTAAEHHGRLLRKSKEQASIDMHLNQLTPIGVEEELRMHKIKYTSVLLENYEQRRQLEELETELSNTSTSLETMKQVNQDLKAEVEGVSKKRAYTSKYNDMLRKQLESATKRAQGLDAKVSYIEGVHGNAKTHVNRLLEEKDLLKAEILHLKNERHVLLEKREQELAKFESQERFLKSALSELSAQRAANMTLTNQVEYLKKSEKLLQKSISACWFHDIYVWVMGLFGYPTSINSTMTRGEKAGLWV